MAASTTLTPSERSLRARLASHTRWAQTSPEDARKTGEAAQRGLVERFAREIDPDESLNPEERYRRARHARDAHMARLALASAKARRKRSNGAQTADSSHEDDAG